MKSGMKQTVIGEIPVDWEVTTLGNSCELFMSNVDKKSREGEKEVSLCNYMDVYNNHYITSRIDFMRATATQGQIDKFLLRRGDVIITKDSETKEDIAQAATVAEDFEDVLCGYHLALIRPHESKFNGAFLASLFGLDSIRKQLTNKANGTTRFGLNVGTIEEAVLPLPPLPEQQKIAEILSTVDEKMAVIDEQLAQTQELKKGLMQRLLTKGIGHTVFKDSPLGEIPESWEVGLLDSVAKRGSGHTPSKSFPEYYNGEIKWISLGDSHRLDNRWIKDTKTSISALGIKNSSAVLHPKGTVLLSRDAGVGKSAVMYEAMAVSQHFITWNCGPKLNNWFLYYFLQHNKPYFERIAAGSTIKTIGLPVFKKLTIPVPPIMEQELTAEILTTVDDKLQVLTDKKAQYQELKRGLMQQLLTGQRRVRVAAELAAV